MGYQRTLLKTQTRFFWPGMTSDIEPWCKQCDICQRRQAPNPKPRAVLQQIVGTRPGEIVHADLLELTKTPSGNKYVVALIVLLTSIFCSVHA